MANAVRGNDLQGAIASFYLCSMRWSLSSMRQRWLPGLSVLALLGLFVLAAPVIGAWVLFGGVVFGDTCGYELKSAATSPDGQYKAGVVEVNCGATTSYANWAVLAKANRDFDYRNDRLAAVETQAMKVHWEGRKLVVRWRADLRANLAKKQPSFVEYRPL